MFSRREFLKAFGIQIGGLILGKKVWNGLFSRSLYASEISKRIDCSDTDFDKPNVIIVITDDQGYGDMSCHGNPVIKTPNIDKLYKESVRLTNFHVSPTCAPTRASLMTGRYCNRTGVWHTIMGRSFLRKDEVTLADVFSQNGYQTAIFGKWHLGDNYPYRPQDRGFKESLIFGGGVIGETPDNWGNDYYDDTYYHNGKPEKYHGYCTDVWFSEAIKFVHKNKDRPFFVYISTNAPHGPFNVPHKYVKPYLEKGVKEPRARFYGMITNIDENIGKLINELKKLNLYQKSIFIFMTDNGTTAGVVLDKNKFPQNGFNAGMRGKKGDVYEGGHRVPFFIHWPERGISGGKDINKLAAHIDLMPTLIDMCKLKISNNIKFDGVSLKSLLTGEEDNWIERTLVVDDQRLEYLTKYKEFAVMTDKWRLIGNYGQSLSWKESILEQGEPIVKDPWKSLELYDMEEDPGQRHNVAWEHPEVVEQLFDFYEKWWEEVSRRSDEYCRIIIGSEKENPVKLTCQSWHGKGLWNQQHVRMAARGNGFWAIEIVKDGVYEIELRRYPREDNRPIRSTITLKELFEGLDTSRIYMKNNMYQQPSKPLNAIKARIEIQGIQKSRIVNPDDISIKFRISLKAGKTFLKSYFYVDDSAEYGAYYVYVTRIS